MQKMIILFALCVLFVHNAYAQNELPDVKVRNLSGKEISFNTICKSTDTALVISFWATWCIPCITEMELLNEQYEDKRKEFPYKIIAVSIDDTRTANKVRPFVKGRGWQFDFYTDTNHDLKRALNINDIPHILIIKNGKIIYQHTGYTPGNEENIYQKLKTN